MMLNNKEANSVKKQKQRKKIIFFFFNLSLKGHHTSELRNSEISVWDSEKKKKKMKNHFVNESKSKRKALRNNAL